MLVAVHATRRARLPRRRAIRRASLHDVSARKACIYRTARAYHPKIAHSPVSLILLAEYLSHDATVNCQPSEWVNGSSCSQSCGGGVLTQYRTIISQPKDIGALCPITMRVVPCNIDACAICTGGQIFSECGSPCTPTCDDPSPFCPSVCLGPRCQCRPGYLWNGSNCTLPSLCPAPSTFPFLSCFDININM